MRAALSPDCQVLHCPSCICLWRKSAARGGTTHSGTRGATTVVSVCFLFLVSTPVPGVGKGPGAWPGKLDMRQPLQFPWETENIFLALWMRKLKQRERHPRFSKEEEEPRVVRLRLRVEQCSLALAGHPSSFWEPNSSGDRRNMSC